VAQLSGAWHVGHAGNVTRIGTDPKAVGVAHVISPRQNATSEGPGPPNVLGAAPGPPLAEVVELTGEPAQQVVEQPTSGGEVGADPAGRERGEQ
jgi:hypothetical protein